MSDDIEKFTQEVLARTGKTVIDDEVLEEAKVLYDENLSERATKREALKKIIKDS